MGEQVQDGYKALLNEGQDNEMEIFGYKTVQFRKIMFILGYIFSFGLLWIVFYWKPEWNVWAFCDPCKLQDADVVLLRETDEFKNYTRKKVMWTHLSELNPVMLEKLDGSITQDKISNINKAIFIPEFKIRHIHVQKIKYIWLISEKKFQKAGALEDDYSCSEIHSRFGQGLPIEEQNLRRLICGPNAIEVEVVPVWKLLFKQVLNPFYLFQIASLSLWLAEGYIEYSIVIIIITVLSIILTVFDLRQQSVKLNRLVEANNSAMVTIRNSDGDYEVESRHLVPGDIILLTGKRFFLPCDCILLKGGCIVNEGMLTGESIPVTKTPLEYSTNHVPWKIESGEDYKRHVLFCGTEVIQAMPSSHGPATAVVMQTGFNTAKGDMVRSILFPKPLNFKLYQDATRFLMCLIGIATIGFIYSVIVFKVNGASVRDIIVYALISVTVAIPPVLPAAVAVALMYAQKRLKKQKIFCLSPQRINVCGQINLVCFDKTGTLTEDGLDLWGVVPAIGDSFQKVHMFTNGNNLTWGPLLAAMTSCHSIIILDGKMQGDPLDLKMFEGTNWEIEDSGQVENDEEVSTAKHLVLKPGPNSGSVPVEGITILQQFPFSSSLQRMSVISQVLGTDELFVFMKGAPVRVTQFCLSESVPQSFANELQVYTLQGFRVIGLAYKSLQGNKEGKDSYTREEVESGLIFLGLLILENRLKEETYPALIELNNALIRTVMVTGDNLQTAITVARNSGLIQRPGKVILIEASEPNESSPASISWKEMENDNSDMHEITEPEIDIEKSKELQKSSTYYFAMTGKVYQVIVQYFYDLLPKLLLNGAIFARMSPGQKADLIEEFQKMDYYVAMCGDGANDCGALKVAHAGISLSEHEASVASPFTSQTANIQCVPQLIKEGRAALVASFAVFKYVTLYAMIQFICLLILFWQLKSVGLYQYLLQDVGCTILVSLTSSLTHAYQKLAPYRPPAQLISPPLLLSVIINVLLTLACQICGFIAVQKQPWYSSTDFRACAPSNGSITGSSNISDGSSNVTEEVSIYESYETTTLWPITTISLVIMAFVFAKGKPFRKPIYTNYIFVCLLPLQLAAFLFILFANFESVYKGLQLVCTPTLWRIYILIMLVVFFLVSFAVEELIIENRKLWLCLKRIFKYQSHSQYRVLHRMLQNDPSWPPLNVTQYANSTSKEINGEVYLNVCYVDDENVLKE